MLPVNLNPEEDRCITFATWPYAKTGGFLILSSSSLAGCSARDYYLWLDEAGRCLEFPAIMMGQDIDQDDNATSTTMSTAPIRSERTGTSGTTTQNRGFVDGEVEIPRLMIPDINKAMIRPSNDVSKSHPLSSQRKPPPPPPPPSPNVPDGASNLVGLFAPLLKPPGAEIEPPVSHGAPTMHHANGPIATSKPHQENQQDRPTTPPPFQHHNSNRSSQRGGDGAGSDGPCPPSPGGMTWSKAGSTFNLVPSTLIDNVREKIRLERLEHLPRLVLRNRAFHQSANKVHIRHNKGASIYKLLRFNWFHVLMRWPTKYSLFFLLSIWTLMILFFAAMYVWYDVNNSSVQCGLGSTEGKMLQFAGAFALSLETCTTVGYGLPSGVNAFFEKECRLLQVIIFYQTVWSMLFNAFLLTFMYSRLGRSETRGAQVIFSNKALVSIVDDQVRFQVRIFDCDAKHPVVEAHVRMYCVMKQRPIPRPLRILQPDDELGSMLFLSFPSVVCHNIDMYSLLHPPVPSMLMKPCGLVLRQVDGDISNRGVIVCPICGEYFGTFDRWFTHVRYQQVLENNEDYPALHTHLSLDLDQIEKEPSIHPISDIAHLQQHFKDNVSEILCLVEGIDPMQSGTFQASQSYRYEDIEWYSYAQFAPCLSIENKSVSNNRIFSVDLDRYHDVVPDVEAEKAAQEELAGSNTNSIRAGDVTVGTTPLASTVTGTVGPGGGGDIDFGSGGVAIDNSKVPALTGHRKRHRRIKTLSNGISDGLFASPVPGHKRKLSGGTDFSKAESLPA